MNEMQWEKKQKTILNTLYKSNPITVLLFLLWKHGQTTFVPYH